jgi:hypothetical protein
MDRGIMGGIIITPLLLDGIAGEGGGEEETGEGRGRGEEKRSERRVRGKERDE